MFNTRNTARAAGKLLKNAVGAGLIGLSGKAINDLTATNPKPVHPKTSGRRHNQTLSSSSSSPGKVLTAPVAMSRAVIKHNPKRVNLPNGDILVTHREYITDLACSSAFSATPFVVNPGNPIVFPWLSLIASAFEKYRFEKLCFRYLTDCSTSSAGRIMLAVDFDSTDAAPTSKTQIFTYRNCVSAPVWSETCYEAAKIDLHAYNQYYVSRSTTTTSSQTSVPSAMDRTNNTGIFYAASQGGAGSITGELYVEYTIRLINPQLSTNALSYFAVYDNSTTMTANNLFESPVGQYPTVPSNGCFISSPSTQTPQFVGVTFVNPSGVTGLQFALIGKYVISGYITGTGMGTITTGAGTTASALQLPVGTGPFYFNSVVDSTGSSLTYSIGLRVTSQNQAYCPRLVTATTVTSNRYIVSQIDQNPS